MKNQILRTFRLNFNHVPMLNTYDFFYLHTILFDFLWVFLLFFQNEKQPLVVHS